MGMILLNKKNTIKLCLSIFLLLFISIFGNNKSGIGRLLNRMDNQFNKSKINFSFNIYDMNNNDVNLDLSNIYVFIEGDNGDRYIIDLSSNKKISIDELFDYEYNNLHDIVSQNYNIIVAKKKDNSISFDKTKSFRELSDKFIQLYNGYKIDGEYELIIPNNIYISESSSINLNIYAKEIYGNKINLDDILKELKPYTNYNIFTKYYSQITKSNLSICTDTIVRINNIINNKYYINNIYSKNYTDNNIYNESKYLSSIINNNSDNYMDLLNDIYLSNNSYNLVLNNKIDFNNELNILNKISEELYNGSSSNNKFYYVTIDEENSNIYNYNNSNYAVVNIDCTNNEIVHINSNYDNIIYNFYKIVNGKKVQYDGEIFINNIGKSSILLAPSAYVHSSNKIISNIISYEYIQE